MSLEQRVYSVLLVSSSPRLSASLADLLPSSVYFPVHTVKNIGAAERSVLSRSYDFVIISSPLPEDSGTEFAIDIGHSKSSVVLLLVQNEIHDDVFSKVAEHGVFTLSKPISRQTFQTAVRWMQVVRDQQQKNERKALSIEEKMAEIRLVNRAKWILIRELNMDEPEAHHYIEKEAMDRCISKREVAETLIRTYSYH